MSSPLPSETPGDPRGTPQQSLPLVVRVPASSSNLGCGFDALGLALDLWLEVLVVPAPVPTAADGPRVHLELTPEGPKAWPEPGQDLLIAALARSLEHHGAASPGTVEGIELRVRSSIPIGRGLGSSGAATAAGLLLGRAMACGETKPLRGEALDDLLDLGLILEGHPDNVTASLVGGCTICVPRDGGPPALARVPLHTDLAFAVAWPGTGLDTGRARSVLPAQVPLADAVENGRRAALLVHGLRTGDPDLLAAGFEDRLHVPYRIELLPGSKQALAAARQAGAYAATLSGAGSGLIAVAPINRAEAVAQAMQAALDPCAGPATGRVLRPVLDPPRVESPA